MYWVRRLWLDAHFGNEQYKGQAGRTLALMSLLRWYAETLWLRVPELEAAARCFLLLRACHDAFTQGKHTKDWARLATAQRKHQEAFARLRPDYVRPKHHHRLHLPQQYSQRGIPLSCWGVESSHQAYKTTFADSLQQFLTPTRGGADFSANLLPRLLLRHCELFNELPFLQRGWQLIREFPESQVLAETGVPGCTISARCRLHTVELMEHNFLLWDLDWKQGGRVNFFLESQSNLFVCISPLVLESASESARTFRIATTRQLVAFESLSNLKIPAWTSVENDKVICLP